MTETYEEGYYEQATVAEATTPITVLSKIGQPIGEKPIVEFGIVENVTSRELMGQYYPTLEAGNKRMDIVNLHFYPINMRFAYFHYGKRSAVTGSRTIQHMDGLTGGLNALGRKPRITIWKKSKNDKRHCHGILLNTLNIKWGKTALEVMQSGKGMVNNTDAYTPTITFEDDIKDIYNHCSVCTWAGGANMGAVGFELNSSHAIDPVPGASAYQDFNEYSVIPTTIQIMVLAANGETMLADWDSSTAREFIITFNKSGDSTKSITFTTTARIKQITRNEIKGIDPIYTMMLECGQMVITGDDGC